MGLTKSRVLLAAAALPLLTLSVFASPKLRLATTAVGPISVAANANGPTQTVEAYNAGDGSLVLQTTSNLPWVVPTAIAPAPCVSRVGTCIPIRLELRTATLARGTQTAVITVADPNALDAPQTLTVTVQVGGGIPDALTQYVAPGKTAVTTLTSNSSLGYQTATQSGGQWLSVASDAGGSYRAVYSYQIRMSPPAGTPEGTYNGTATFTNSAIAAENKTMNATMRVTNGPILTAPPRAALKLRTNSGKGSTLFAFTNEGSGTIAISGYTPTTVNGGNWLSAETPPNLPGYVQITADTTALSPGYYTGQLAIASNAANSPTTLAVDLEIVNQSAPTLSFGGVLHVGSLDPKDQIAPGTWVELYGDQLTNSTELRPNPPHPTSLSGVRVLVSGIASPLWYLSPKQINFQIPYEVQPGEGFIQVERDGQVGNRLSIMVAEQAPRIRAIRGSEYTWAFNSSDGAQAAPIPVLGLPARPVRRGEGLVMYVIGFGQTSPPVQSGAAAPLEPLARVPTPTKVVFGTGVFGGITADALYAGLTPNYAGLYQVNIIVPDNAPVGDSVPISLESGTVRSPIVRIAIQ